jgi:hypothetical protein
MPSERRDPDFFEIDKNNLDRECVRQPKLYHKYAMQLVHRRRDLEQAKARLEIVSAETGQKVRRRAPDKLTEKMVQEQTLTNGKYIAALKELMDLQHEVNVLVVAVDTLDHRKRALENLVKLRLADYFAEPRVAQDERVRDALRDEEKRQARRALERNNA